MAYGDRLFSWNPEFIKKPDNSSLSGTCIGCFRVLIHPVSNKKIGIMGSAIVPV